MSPDQIEEARRAVERVRDDLGEHKVRAGRDHEHDPMSCEDIPCAICQSIVRSGENDRG